MANSHIYRPVHQWLLRHKLIADGLGVAMDVVGVVAGVTFVIFTLPEIGVVGAIAGGSAAFGSLLLLGTDGAVFVTEVSGDEALSRRIEESQTAQWARIVGTVMTLPDMAVGGVRALRGIAEFGNEIRQATAASRAAADAADAQRMRAGQVRHAQRHPAAVQQHQARANRFARAAEQQIGAARRAQRQLGFSSNSAVAAYAATPTAAAMLTFAPPDMMKTAEQRRRDEQYLHDLEPEGGLPRDVRFDMRVSVLARQS